MKIIIYLFVLYFGVIMSCNQNKKIYIKSVNTPSNKRIDWYFFSLISNFSRSYIQLGEKNEPPFFESFYVSDINMRKDTLCIQLYRNDYKLDSIFLSQNKLNVVIDTAGKIWNQASSRFGRLQRKQVNFSKPHFIDTYCPKNECY